ncbi:HDOD domain-containing protein [Shewanella psychrotolerans]|uniref:HDOD domain-containing protein n=1 Tax=Shewanella psychrotolerans TaxID=2864206 RepID=UPI001C658F2F|nr:HDOD domain-containing protein [Shewanella psychrotolerans]QYK01218.1 HDOD domain-containing protein [Shewanella psychrotolerans]
MINVTLLNHIDELPRLPKAISELLETVNQEEASVTEISAKIGQDPLIGMRVLRLANSAHYRRSREVSSIEEAVIRLGIKTVKTLVIASAVISALPKVEEINVEKFWGNTFEVAITAQELARHCSSASDTAFTCGIIHDIGDLLIVLLEPNAASIIHAAVEAGADKGEVEQAQLGFQSHELAALLAQNWKFSSVLIAGVMYQRNPQSADPFSSYAALICLAYWVIKHWPDVPEDQQASSLFAKGVSLGIRLDVTGLVDKLSEQRGKGFEMAVLLT